MVTSPQAECILRRHATTLATGKRLPMSRGSSRRCRSQGSLHPARTYGPQRFFHDKTSHTGVHKRGGPETAQKDSFVLSLRAAHHGHHHSAFTASPGLNPQTKLRPQMLPGMLRIPAPSSPKEIQALKGPERFFYDKNSYTGAYPKGGPKVVDTETHWLRPGHYVGSTFTRTRGSLAKSEELSNSSSSQRSHRRPASAATVRELQGPERFYYDRNTYTGVRAHGHCDLRIGGGERFVSSSYLSTTSASFHESLFGSPNNQLSAVMWV